MDEEEVPQNEANEFFTSTRKRKPTEINDQTLNNQMFLSNIRETNENMLTYSTKEEVLEYHGISAELQSTTIRMQGKQLIGSARGETKLPANDMRLALTKMHFTTLIQRQFSKQIQNEIQFVGY